MLINPIYTNNNSYRFQQKNTNFKAHPDFIELAKRYEVTASSFFRRGISYGSPSERFNDIVNILKKIFLSSPNQKQKLLITGIGNSEEPFSYLASIKEIIKTKKLEDTVDLNIVDLQSRPDKKTLFKNSFYEYNEIPPFAASSFVKDSNGSIIHSYPRSYRVNDEIFDFLNSTYNNKEKSLWDTRIQEAIKSYATESFDAVSINNTLPYITSRIDRIDTIRNAHRILKKGGIFITDPYLKIIEEARILDKFEKIHNGIYKKI